jgi:TonB family protein
MMKLSAFTLLLFLAPLLVHAQAQSPAADAPNNPNASAESAQAAQSDEQPPQDNAKAGAQDDENAPAAQSIAQVSDPYVDAPRLVRGANPKYPKDARNVGHQGTSVLSLVVGIDGRPRDITIVRPLDPELDDCAIAAVSKWRYQPAERDGEPVEVRVHTRVRFRVYNKSYGKIAELWDRSDANDPKADLRLSRAYIDGNGVAPDDRLAFEFLKMAADWNLPEAQFLMGEHYYRESAPPDYVNAYMWYALSKRSGGKDGEAMLKALASEMTPEQIGEADTRIGYWPEDPPKQDSPRPDPPQNSASR